MPFDPDLTDDVTAHTDRKDGTLHVLLVDEIDDETLDEYAGHPDATAPDGGLTEDLKDELVEAALVETIRTDIPEVLDPLIPTVVTVDTDRDVSTPPLNVNIDRDLQQ